MRGMLQPVGLRLLGFCTGQTALAPVGDVPADPLQALETELHRPLTGHEQPVGSDLRQTSGCSTKLLMTLPGIATRNLLNKLGKPRSARQPPG